MELAERQSDLLTALNYTYKGRFVGGMSSSKRLPCQKEACAIQKCLQGKQTLEFCLLSYQMQSIEFHEKNMSKKFKVNFFINLIKLKLILMSILFWPETQIVEIVDLVDQKNSYIGTASRVMLASGDVAICCR